MSGTEDGAISLSGITVTTTDVDGSETASALIKVPQGFVLSVDMPPLETITVAGGDGQPSFALNADGDAVYAVYSVPASEMSNMQMVRDPSVADSAHYSGPLKVYVTGVSTELEGGHATTEASWVLNITPEADGAQLSSAPAQGVEDGGAIALNLSASLIDSSESYVSFSIVGADLTKLSFIDGDGAPVTDLSSLTLQQVQGLQVVPGVNVSGEFSFAFKAVTQDGSDTAESARVVELKVTPEADTPSLTVTPTQSGPYAFSGNEDTPIALDYRRVSDRHRRVRGYGSNLGYTARGHACSSWIWGRGHNRRSQCWKRKNGLLIWEICQVCTSFRRRTLTVICRSL